MKKIINITFSVLLPFIVMSTTFGCKKFLEVGAPQTSMNSENVYTTDATATSVLTGIYITLSMADLDNGELNGISLLGGLSSDELKVINNDARLLSYFNNALNAADHSWANYYRMVFTVNSAIEGLSGSNQLTPGVKKQLLGEAMFLRGLCYFYLVNLYGDVPLALTTDYKVNSTLPRSSTSAVYDQIVSDLNQAQEFLAVNYVSVPALASTSERVRPNRATATALLSRVYLFTGRYADAEVQSSQLIADNNYELMPLNGVFLSAGNKEAIWQIQNVGLNTTSNTRDGSFFIPMSATLNARPVYLTDGLYHSFEAYDQRRAEWTRQIEINSVPYYYAFKYKIGPVNTSTVEYATVFRLAEQYLIRAEARIALNRISEGISDLNVIRKRATDLSAAQDKRLSQLPLDLSKQEALLAVENERRHELFTEWGHRWLDLKRTGRANAVIGPLKGAGWASTDQLYPIPLIDMSRNPSLQGHQNPGYQ